MTAREDELARSERSDGLPLDDRPLGEVAEDFAYWLDNATTQSDRDLLAQTGRAVLRTALTLSAQVAALRDRCERQERLLAELRAERDMWQMAAEQGAWPYEWEVATYLRGQLAALKSALADEPQGNEGEGA